jgi:hypothetical protein
LDVAEGVLPHVLPLLAIFDATGTVLSEVIARSSGTPYIRATWLTDIRSARLAQVRAARLTEIGATRLADVWTAGLADVRTAGLADVDSVARTAGELAGSIVKELRRGAAGERAACCGG